MFFLSQIINEYDSIVKRENEYFSIFVSVAQFYCELSMTQALFFVQADQICGRLAAVLTSAADRLRLSRAADSENLRRTGCAWAPSFLLSAVSSACPAAAPAVRPSRSARPAARPAVLPCPGPAVPLLLCYARPALLRRSGGQPSALPAASKKLRHPAGGSAHGGRETLNRQTGQLRQADRTITGRQYGPGRSVADLAMQAVKGRRVEMWLQPLFLTRAETFPDRAAAAQRKSRRMWSQIRLRSWAALPLLPLPCRHGAGGGLVRSTAIKYTKKPPRADWRRRRLFMAYTSGSGTGSGALTGSGFGGSWSGTRLGGFRHRHPRPGLPIPAPERSKRGKSKKDETALPEIGKAVKEEQDGAGLQRMEAGQKWNTVFRPKLRNFGSQGKS